jgi:hypothetical protein
VVARDIDAHGLLGEDVLLRRNGGRDVHGAEARRGRQDHEVDVGQREQLLVAVEAAEDAVVGHIGALGVRFLERVAHALRLLEVDVAHRDELHVGIRGQRVVRGARAAASAADESDAHDGGRTASLLRPAGETERRHESGRKACRSDRGCGGEEVTAGLIVHRVLLCWCGRTQDTARCVQTLRPTR